MNTMKNLLIFSLLLVLNANSLAQATVSFRIKKRKFEFDSKPISITVSNEHNSFNGLLVEFQNLSPDVSEEFSLLFYNVDFQEGREYLIGDTGDLTGTDNHIYPSFSYLNQKGKKVYSFSTDEESKNHAKGKLKITKYDPIQKIIEGVFQFSLKLDGYRLGKGRPSLFFKRFKFKKGHFRIDYSDESNTSVFSSYLSNQSHLHHDHYLLRQVVR